MTYTNNVPQGSQQISATTQPIQNNFGYIDTAMKINHTWDSTGGNNDLAGEANGSHQKLNFPNQPSPITGSLPTGIAAIQYCSGGNLYSWNGTKQQPVSGIVFSGSGTMTSAPQTLVTLPANAIGTIIITFGTLGYVFSFYSIAGSPNSVVLSYQSAGFGSSPRNVVQSISGQELQFNIVGSSVAFSYKYIYWPV